MTKFTQEFKNYIDFKKREGEKLNVFELLGWLHAAMPYNPKTYKTNKKEYDLLTEYIDMIIKGE